MNTKGVKNMRTFILSSFLFVVCTIGLMAAERQPVVEMHADRTIIYPQRMELSGEETLMDILEMYPELMVAGFDDLLKGGSPFDSWQLRMDNVAISGDTRLMLTQIKARNISKIQICDNAGVAKGRTGDGRVIDINLLQAEEGAHGYASLQGATDHMLSPSLNMHYGSPSTDIWSSVTYKHTDISGQVDNTENLYVQMTNRFSPRDRLLSYITQSSSVSDAETFGNLKHGRSESIMARFRYFHTFNEQGTELLTVVSWQHKNNPNDVLNTPQQTYRRVNSHTNSPLWILELNTPLPVKGLSMMVGYEGDLDVNRYGIQQSPVEGKAFDEESTYQLMNNDFYLQLNYLVGPLRLTVGDRVMFYHYQQKGYVDNWSKNSTRNNFHASIIVKAACRHQLQAAYFRKFRNPSAMGVFPELWQFIDLICLARCIFSCKTAPVESGGLPARPRIVCNREISVLVVSASDFMHIGLVLACKCFEHTVLHHVCKNADFIGVICDGIEVVQPHDFRIVGCQDFNVRAVHQFTPVEGNESLFAVICDLDFHSFVFE